MAYREKAHKPDIRSLALHTLPKATDAGSSSEVKQTTSTPTLTLHPSTDLIHIAACSIPLIILLIIGSYLDTTRHWVIPFAHWLFRLGS